MASAMVTLAAGVAASSTSSDESTFPHIRSTSAAIRALIDRASGSSATFRGLVADINATDGIVYILEGKCHDSAHACFIGVASAGSGRTLWVRVNLKMHDADWDAMGSIAHELSHTLEILAVPSIRSTDAMLMFYRSAGFHGSPQSYETRAAIDVGDAVRSEVRASIWK